MDENTRILIGYWADNESPESWLPNPKNLIAKNDYWDNVKKELCKYRDPKITLIKYLISYGTPCNYYRGYSSCRICNERLGSHEFKDEIYVWPEGLDHYIEDHNIMLPTKFLTHVYTKMDDFLRTKINLDFSLWIDWNKESDKEFAKFDHSKCDHSIGYCEK